jgi:hypothetical protein
MPLLISRLSGGVYNSFERFFILNPLFEKEYPGLKRQDILACIRYAQEVVRLELVYSTTAHGTITG